MKKLIVLSIAILIGSNLLQAQFNGQLDSTYVENGINLTDQGVYFLGAKVESKFDSQGNLYVGGTINRDSKDFFIARFTPDGALDPAFGNAGKIYFDPTIGGDDYFKDLAITQDDKIVVVGYTYIGDSDQILARFNSDGSIDDTFLNTGFVITGGDHDDVWETCMVDHNNRLILAGYTSDAEGSNLTALRLLEDGSFDSDFGDNGLFLMDNADYEYFSSVIQTAPNRYYLIATINNIEHIVALSGTGTLVNGFGDAGLKDLNLFPNLTERFNELKSTTNGSLVICGYTLDINSNSKVMVVKLTSEGDIDIDFGTDGYYNATLNTGIDPLVYNIHIQDDQSLLFTGSVTFDGNRNFMTFILSENGLLDAGYGTNGLMTYGSASNANEYFGKSLLDPDGNIFLYGVSDEHEDGITVVIMKLKTTDQNVSTKEVQNSSVIQLNISPNPVIDQLSVSFNLENNTEASLLIFDLNGRQISIQDLGYLFSGENNLDLTTISSQLSSGFYLMIIETEHSIYTGKIVKQ